MKKWKDGEDAVLMWQTRRDSPFHGIALMKVHVKENLYNPQYPKLSAQTTANIFGNAYRDYRMELKDYDAYTYHEAIKELFEYGVKE